MLLVGFRPEETEQSIPPVEPAGRRKGEIGKERQALGLGDDGEKLLAVGIPEVERAESVEADHRRYCGRGPRRDDPDHGWITLGS